MKYIIYYLLPCRISYKLLYETMGITTGFLSFKNSKEASLKATYVTYDEYKHMNKADKLYYFDAYVKHNKILNMIDSNKWNIISIIGIIATFIFGFISIL